FKAAGVDLPTAAISIPIVWSVLLPLAVGLGAALVASIAPAVKATRVLPIAAGAIIAFLGVAMLSRLLIVPIAAVLGAVLEVALRLARFLGGVRDRIPVV